MTLMSILGFALAMFILTATPGPGVLAVVSQSLRAGFKSSIVMIAGIVTGDLFYLTFAIFGLSFIARSISPLFTLIRIAGGLYMIFIGVRAIVQKEPGELSEGNGRKGSSTYLSGLFLTLSNPKVVVFYCGFLPTFLDLETLRFSDGLIISALVMTILGTVMLLYAKLADYIRSLIRGPRSMRLINASAGGFMTAAGTLLVAKTVSR
ncbi:LysE family translocator [Sediminispirochaeta smaragdinae]|uniref:Lysine exporter protein (LYSE/YGGA) n=1 Tax=Sediminispirochaeta smaragdinae (strain DSM 11293 / JCM 15392 / SEBR 4228) TaxID=573413 RepID=E1RAN4_SEDSS|nr:LysE family translocator [Sediminispirochaeta smaragdinae]ADK82402.1 Lysine exporter protein (LYSE/YGGA) [Sediminispirochaeta smaragdinae DSM 11293]